MRKAAALRRLPVRLDRVDLVIAVVHALVVMHFVEDEVLEFRTEIGSVADARAGEIGLRFPDDIARIRARAAKARRSLLAQPRLLKSASSRFLPVHKADLERQQRAESVPTGISSGRTGIWAKAVIQLEARSAWQGAPCRWRLPHLISFHFTSLPTHRRRRSTTGPSAKRRAVGRDAS
jgi:hypothetical protein